jgi:hypothetical protein
VTDLVRRWFGVAVGGLHWSPRAFWRSTIDEYLMAVEGHNQTQRSGPTPLTRAELEDLEDYAAEQAAKRAASAAAV